MDYLNITLERLKASNPLLLGVITNSLGQRVEFYEHPFEGDMYPVIAVIEDKAMNTGFFDMDDFYEGSEYLPYLRDNEIKIL